MNIDRTPSLERSRPGRRFTFQSFHSQMDCVSELAASNAADVAAAPPHSSLVLFLFLFFLLLFFLLLHLLLLFFFLHLLLPKKTTFCFLYIVLALMAKQFLAILGGQNYAYCPIKIRYRPILRTVSSIM